MKKRILGLFGIILLVLTLSFIFVSASMNYHDLDLTSTTIGKSQLLTGTINLTLTNQNSGVLVKAYIDSVEKKSMYLLDFLSDANVVKSCSTTNCDKTFSRADAGTAELYNFNAKNNSYLGFYIPGGNVVEIQDLSFDISGDSYFYESCGDSSFKMDLLGDEAIEYEYNNPGNAVCGLKKYPSKDFSLSQVSGNTIIENIPSCEKIYIPKTGSIDVRATIPVGDGGGNLIAKVYDPLDTSKEIGSCTMYGDDENYSCSILGGPLSSTPDFFIKEAKEYYVCLNDKASSNAYKILTEQSSPFSGFNGLNNAQTPNKDFAIYISVYSFAPFSDYFTFSNETSLNQNLKQYIQTYVSTKYSNNCSKGCIIPLKFISQDPNQKINISNMDFKVRADGALYSYNLIYNVVSSFPSVNISTQSIDIGFLNLTSPSTSGSHKLKISVGDASKEATFTVADAPKIISLSPLQTIPNRETRFFVSALPSSSSKPIVSYKWNFNDGSLEQSTTDSFIIHTLPTAQTYNVIITVTDNESISSSSSFMVSTNLSFNYVSQSLNNKLTTLNNFNSKLNSQEAWLIDLFEINITQLNQTLLSYRAQISNSTSQQQLLTIQQALDSITIPEDIAQGVSLSESAYYSSPEFISPIQVARLTDTESDYDSSLEDYYKNAIALWEENNLGLGIGGYVKGTISNGISQNKFSVLTISLDPTAEGLQNIFLIVQLPSGVSYNNILIKDNSSLNTIDLDDAVGFRFDSLENKKYIYIAMPGSQDLTRTRFFVSPDLNEFQGSENPIIPEKTPPWVLIVFVIVLIIAGFGVGMWFLWRDYDAKLEKKLFLNRNDLITLINYISSALASKTEERDILDKLMKAGWKKDQIKYALKKVKKQIKEKEKQKSGKEAEKKF